MPSTSAVGGVAGACCGGGVAICVKIAAFPRHGEARFGARRADTVRNLRTLRPGRSRLESIIRRSNEPCQPATLPRRASASRGVSLAARQRDRERARELARV